EDDLGGGQGSVELPGPHVVGAAFGGTRPGVVGPELGVVVLGIGLDDDQVRRLPGDLGRLGQDGAEVLATKADPLVLEDCQLAIVGVGQPRGVVVGDDAHHSVQCGGGGGVDAAHASAGDRRAQRVEV